MSSLGWLLHPRLPMVSILLLSLLGGIGASSSLAASDASSCASCQLRVLAITPGIDSAGLQHGDRAVQLSGRASITVTFNRAVIALGSDFAPGALPDTLTPFTLEPPVSGKLRWVTTSIARFDADEEWPPELELTLSLNPALRSFDGLALAGRSASVRTTWRFSTPQLYMYAAAVASPTASRLTNGTWSSTLHPLAPGAPPRVRTPQPPLHSRAPPADPSFPPGAHEMPPDGSIELRFSCPVDLADARSALTLRLPPGIGSAFKTGAMPLAHARHPRLVSSGSLSPNLLLTRLLSTLLCTPLAAPSPPFISGCGRVGRCQVFLISFSFNFFINSFSFLGLNLLTRGGAAR